MISVLYGVFCPSLHRSRGTGQPPFIEDSTAFLVIAVSGRKRGIVHAVGVPTILGNILKDATIYFLVVFAGQLLEIFFALLKLVSDFSADSFSSAHLIMVAHRNRSKRFQRGKSSPSNIPIMQNPTMCSPAHSANSV